MASGKSLAITWYESLRFSKDKEMLSELVVAANGNCQQSIDLKSKPK